MHKYLFYKILTENGEKLHFKIWRNPCSSPRRLVAERTSFPFTFQKDGEFVLQPPLRLLKTTAFQYLISFPINDHSRVKIADVIFGHGGGSMLFGRRAPPQLDMMQNVAQAETKVSRDLQVFDVARRVDVRAVVGLSDKLAVQVRMVCYYVTTLCANEKSNSAQHASHRT